MDTRIVNRNAKRVESRAQAENLFTRWNAEEERIIIDNPESDIELAKILGRTFDAVQAHRRVMRGSSEYGRKKRGRPTGRTEALVQPLIQMAQREAPVSKETYRTSEAPLIARTPTGRLQIMCSHMD